MDPRPVAVIDSGIGGLPYLSWIQENLTHETLIYCADRKNFPYGEKSPEEVQRAVSGVVEVLVQKFNPKLLVVACNTASVMALSALRQRFDFPVVGVVPAVKTAAQVSVNRRIGVLATAGTVKGQYLTKLIQETAPETQMFTHGAGDIVTHVEEDYLNPDLTQREAILSRWARVLRDQQVDTVVLGCTHFLHVSEDLQRALGPGIRIVDSRDGVGRQVGRLLESHKIQAGEKAVDRFFYTAPVGGFPPEQGARLEEKFRIFSQRYRLEFSGALEL